MSIWKNLIRVCAVAGATAVGGPAGGALAGSAVSALLPKKERDLFDEWRKYAAELRDDTTMDNEQRRDYLEARIREALFRRDGEIPKDRKVEWCSSTVVMAIEGDFDG